MKYRIGGKEKLLSFGSYPEVRPPEAREKVKAARDTIRAGTDPSKEKNAVKREKIIANASTFEIVAGECRGRFAPHPAPRKLVVIDKASTNAPATDQCRLGRERGA